MKNNTLSIMAFIVTIIAIIATLAGSFYSEGGGNAGRIELEGFAWGWFAWGCLGLSTLGCVLGWCSFKCPLGKVSAILGTLLVAAYLLQLFRSGSGPNEEIGPPKAAVISPSIRVES